MSNQEEVVKRLLLAMSVLSGRRQPQELTPKQLIILGIAEPDDKYPIYSDYVIREKCEALIVGAIMAGGYR